ncbi:MAG: hypothetical protein JO231_06210 [Acidobacteria bacterium]|nr:hypothetical protein [Acidobacteriota bacterium]
MPDLAIQFNRRANVFTLITKTNRVRERLREMCISVCNLLGHNDDLWEIRNIGIPNLFKELASLGLELEMRVLQDYLLTNPGDERRRARLAKVRRTVERMARSAGYVD